LSGGSPGHAPSANSPDGPPVAASTLHSLALRVLRQANALAAYPADPVVLAQWELRNIFEAEFGKTVGINGVKRPEQIRRDHEAYCATGQFDPPSVVPPDPPISEDERVKFTRFHRPRSQLYSCVLPGEVVASAWSAWTRARWIRSSC
jgi:hypothetical protein